jgi:hypothetical protein
LAVALAALAFFYAVRRRRALVQSPGRDVRSAGLSILVLVVPGLFAIHPSNYRPFFTRLDRIRGLSSAALLRLRGVRVAGAGGGPGETRRGGFRSSLPEILV